MLLTKRENEILLDLLKKEKVKMEIDLKDDGYASFSPDKIERRKVFYEITGIIRKLEDWV